MDRAKKRWIVSFPLALLAAAVAFGLWQWRSAGALEQDLKTIREKAYFSALDGLTNLETDLSKAMIAESAGQHALLLGHASSLARSVSENLSALPPAYGADENGLKFLNQAGDYAQTLASAAADGRLPGGEDLRQLSVLRDKSAELRAHLLNGANFTYDMALDVGKTSGIEYPALLYDGPFSDGIRRGKAKGLSGGDITAEEAVAVATAFVGAERVSGAERAADVNGPVPAYGVLLNLNDVRVTAAVTRQGGRILWLAPETAGFEARLDVEECMVHARAFLTSRGFGEMRASYFQQYDGLCVISFAAVQDDVVLYPDLIKAQVRMDTGQVIGIEANNYWMNHTTRERLVPKLTETEASAFVSDRLRIESARLCVIPIDDGLGSGRTEALCWEFDGAYDEGRYLVYIDAETGDEVQVLKVVLGGGGVLAM